jgi:hypothetical protein
MISLSLYAGLFLHRRKAEDVGPHRKVCPVGSNILQELSCVSLDAILHYA